MSDKPTAGQRLDAFLGRAKERMEQIKETAGKAREEVDKTLSTAREHDAAKTTSDLLKRAGSGLKATGAWAKKNTGKLAEKRRIAAEERKTLQIEKQERERETERIAAENRKAAKKKAAEVKKKSAAIERNRQIELAKECLYYDEVEKPKRMHTLLSNEGEYGRKFYKEIVDTEWDSFVEDKFSKTTFVNFTRIDQIENYFIDPTNEITAHPNKNLSYMGRYYHSYLLSIPEQNKIMLSMLYALHLDKLLGRDIIINHAKSILVNVGEEKTVNTFFYWGCSDIDSRMRHQRQTPSPMEIDKGFTKPLKLVIGDGISIVKDVLAANPDAKTPGIEFVRQRMQQATDWLKRDEAIE